jgi:hypothetical protein
MKKLLLTLCLILAIPLLSDLPFSEGPSFSVAKACDATEIGNFCAERSPGPVVKGKAPSGPATPLTGRLEGAVGIAAFMLLMWAMRN